MTQREKTVFVIHGKVVVEAGKPSSDAPPKNLTASLYADRLLGVNRIWLKIGYW